jgi:hypothetical protein
MENAIKNFPLCFLVAAGGMIAGAAAGCVVYFLLGVSWLAVVLFTVWGVEAGALGIGALELRYKHSRTVLAIWTIVLVGAGVLLTAIIRHILEHHLLAFWGLVVAGVMGVISGLESQRIRRGCKARAWFVVLLWALTPTIGWWLLLPESGVRLVRVRIGGTFLPLFGPWATHVSRLIDFPNAGSFFNVWLALLLSASVASVLILVWILKGGLLRAIGLLGYGLLMFWWYIVGWFQLAACAT